VPVSHSIFPIVTDQDRVFESLLTHVASELGWVE
jgi:hypothetical protein